MDKGCGRPGRAAVATLVALLAVAACFGAGAAAAAGGDYAIAGGSASEQAQVREALDASSFDWDAVPSEVTIHIVRGILPSSYSTPGQIWLDANLLDAGTFSWGVVQMEYGQQVQYALLDQAMRTELTGLLGAQQWCYENPALPPGANGCERFAAMLAWSYWQSPENSMAPAGPGDWSASMSPDAFRALLAQLLGPPAARVARTARARAGAGRRMIR